jgi:hypothetical protein
VSSALLNELQDQIVSLSNEADGLAQDIVDLGADQDEQFLRFRYATLGAAVDGASTWADSKWRWNIAGYWEWLGDAAIGPLLIFPIPTVIGRIAVFEFKALGSADALAHTTLHLYSYDLKLTDPTTPPDGASVYSASLASGMTAGQWGVRTLIPGIPITQDIGTHYELRVDCPFALNANPSLNIAPPRIKIALT